ncbi:hypothetical protein Patl1_26215 [Pistacia atlantica]|uniref:Uncharacterized protein n=1 Tax=Pistacia atlantica TaxID=434234 RepID=A0ACC1B320_9ROSI|nr:hypothetical protein Patl1_26215 [Pistacia atlantica]
MGDRNTAAPKAIWLKQAEEAKLKSEAEKAAAAKAAFEATFKDVANKAREKQPGSGSDSDSEDDWEEDLSNKPIGPVDPAKCTAAGAGIAGGTAGAASSFMVVTKDSDGRKVANGGAQISVKVAPGVGVGGSEQEGIVKDMNDGTYTVTYVVPKRGNYMLSIECNGKPIMGSPFPVFFSAGTSTGGLLGMAPASNFPNLVNQTMPNMPNYSGSVSGAFPGLLGMIPGVVSGASGGAILPGMGASLGEVCRDYLNGRCPKTDCKLNHPPHNLLMTALAATTSMGTLSQVPMAPSAAAMAAAQAIVAAQALQAHAAQVQAQQSTKESSDDKAGKADALKRTLQVSNLSPLLTVEQLKQLFSFCGTVLECTITDSKHFAYIEYSKPEEATAALALNNMDVGGRPLNVEMAKALPPKTLVNSSLASSSLPMMMQQAVAMQQMQFQQALLMQQTLTAQQAANRAASMKTATELAAARAAEISKKLKADGLGDDEKETKEKSRFLLFGTINSSNLFDILAYDNNEVHMKNKGHHLHLVPSRDPSRGHQSIISEPHVRGQNPDQDHRSVTVEGGDHALSRLYPATQEITDLGHREDCVIIQVMTMTGFRTEMSGTVVTDVEGGIQRHQNITHLIELENHLVVAQDHQGLLEEVGHPQEMMDIKLKYRKRSRSKSVEEFDEKIDDVQDRKSRHRERKRSRSLSREVKHHGRGRSPPKTSDESRSRHRKRSRSKSVVGKSYSNEKVDEIRDERSKHHHKRRSRSKSVEADHRIKEKGNESRDRKSKHRDRRRSRSISADGKRRRRSRSPRGLDEGKAKHRRCSRSKSIEGKHHSDDRVGESRDEKSKHRRGRSRLAERRHHSSRLSPGSLEQSELNCKRRSRSQSEEGKHHIDGGNAEPRDHKSMHDQPNLDKAEDATVEPDYSVKDSPMMGDDGFSTSKHKNRDFKKSIDSIEKNHGMKSIDQQDFKSDEVNSVMQSCGISYEAEELRRKEMPDSKLVRNGLEEDQTDY